jgi:hypothetical protein
MTRSTPTLTQSGLLAVLLQRQHYKVIQLAWRRAHRKHMHAVLWSNLAWPLRALMVPMPPAFRTEPSVGAVPHRTSMV